MDRRRALQVAAAAVVSTLCLAFLLADLDGAAWAAVLSAVRPWPLVVALALALTLPFWRAARLAALLPPARRPGGGGLTRIAAEVLLWSFLLPFKLGELSFPWLLHRRLGLPLGEATALFVLVRASDLLAVAGLFAVGAAGIASVGDVGKLALALAGSALLAGPLLLILIAGWWQKRLVRRGGRLARLVDGASHARSGRARFAVVVTTLGLWASHTLLAALVVHAMAATLDLAAIVAASAAGNLAFALPITGVLGLGPQQVAFASTLNYAGLEWARSVAAALGVHAVATAAAVAAGLTAWLTASGPAWPRTGGRAGAR